MRRIYLDYNATCPVRPVARRALAEALSLGGLGNPSSAHAEGRAARRLLEDARDRLAAVLDCRPSQLVFTSGGSESNALAIACAPAERPARVAAIEHPSLLRQPGVETIPVGRDGHIDADLAFRGRPGLVSIGLANHETGCLPDLATISGAPDRASCLLHSDASQALGRIPVSFEALGVDLLTVSGHKVGAPVGIGALVVGEAVGDALARRTPLRGGGQEQGRRAGTPSAALASAFAAAAEEAREHLASRASHYRRWTRDLCSYIRGVDGSVRLNSPATGGLPNTLNVSFTGRPGATLVHRLDLEGVAVSHGSACSSGSLEPSAVLLALGWDDDRARSSVRFSFGPGNSDDDVVETCRRLSAALAGVPTRASAGV